LRKFGKNKNRLVQTLKNFTKKGKKQGKNTHSLGIGKDATPKERETMGGDVWGRKNCERGAYLFTAYKKKQRKKAFEKRKTGEFKKGMI